MTPQAHAPRRISRRVGAIEESATLAIDAEAKRLAAAGEAVIGFGAGEPDFPTPAHVVAAAERACSDPGAHRYSPAGGLPRLKEAVCSTTARDSGVEISPPELIITNGGKQAVCHAFAVLLDPGDEVLLPAPYWTTYPEAIALAGGTAVAVQTSPDLDFCPTVADLEAVTTPRTRALLLCSPSNPTGSVYPPERLEELARWAYGRGLWIVTDEIYEHLTFDDAQHRSVRSLVPEARDRILVINGVAKTYAMTGWRVGWLSGPTDVIAAATRLQSHTTSNVNNVAQHAAVAALEGGLDDVHRMRTAFDRRRQAMVRQLSAVDGVECPVPQGAFYTFPSVHGLIGRRLEGVEITSSSHLAEIVLAKAQVALVPGEAFGTPGYLRLSYALDDERLAEGVGRLADLLGRVD